jgi:hypothetical protein
MNLRIGLAAAEEVDDLVCAALGRAYSSNS